MSDVRCTRSIKAKEVLSGHGRSQRGDVRLERLPYYQSLRPSSVASIEQVSASVTGLIDRQPPVATVAQVLQTQKDAAACSVGQGQEKRRDERTHVTPPRLLRPDNTGDKTVWKDRLPLVSSRVSEAC